MKLKIKSLTEEERVAVWVSKETRKKLLVLKARQEVNNLDVLINQLLLK